MSKEAALRAMREARYNERSAGGSTASRSVKPATRPATRPADRAADLPGVDAAAPVEAADALCGHRSMNGRSCTREHGHTAKNHRYS
jgi:hypothetical protein